MPDKALSPFGNIAEKVIEYLPSLFAGIVLVAVGYLLGWIIKRIIIQLALLLRLEMYLTRFNWGRDFSKADVRYGFYNFIGNIVFFIVFLVFLDNAFTAWKLTILSNLLERGISLIPKIILALVVFGAGWLVTTWASRAVQRALRRENIPRATLLTRFVKAALLLLFGAMALVELGIAREIVIIGFATLFITLGLLAIVLTAIGGKDFIQRIQQSLDED
jgi:hypothetical protein